MNKVKEANILVLYFSCAKIQIQVICIFEQLNKNLIFIGNFIQTCPSVIMLKYFVCISIVLADFKMLDCV